MLGGQALQVEGLDGLQHLQLGDVVGLVMPALLVLQHFSPVLCIGRHIDAVVLRKGEHGLSYPYFCRASICKLVFPKATNRSALMLCLCLSGLEEP